MIVPPQIPSAVTEEVVNKHFELVQAVLDNTETIKYIALYGFGALIMLIAMVFIFIFFMSFKR